MLKKIALFSSLLICNIAFISEGLYASNRPLLAAGCLDDVFSETLTLRYDFKTPQDVEDYVKRHPDIDGIGLIHFEEFPCSFSLMFLNDYPHIKHLILSGKAAEPATFNLSGLQHITHFVNNVQTTRCHRFGNMPYLVELDTTLDQFPFLGAMPNIKKLSLRGNYSILAVKRHIDLSAIENFNTLTQLHIGEIGKIDLSPLACLTKLEKLIMAGGFSSSVRDFSFLRSLKNLEVFNINQDHKFRVYTYQEPPCRPVAIFEKQKISFLNTMLERGFLDLFADLPNLKHLSLNNVGTIDSLHYLSYCKNLQSLYMAGSCTDMTDALRGLPIKTLDISYGYAVDLWGLSEIPSLEVLNVEGDYGRLWKALAEHPSLRRIKASVEGIMADKVFLDSAKSISIEVQKGHFFEQLKTILNLEMLCVATHGLQGVPDRMLAEYRQQVEDFQKARPDVMVGYFDEWEKVVVKRVGQ